MLYCDTANPGLVAISHSSFFQNRAKLGPGGVALIYGTGSSHYRFDHCTMEGNIAAQAGGAMALWGIRGNISQCAFIGNIVPPREQGSSIYMAQGSSPLILRYIPVLLFHI